MSTTTSMKWNRNAFKRNSRVRELEKRVLASLSPAQRKKWARVTKSLDGDFLEEKGKVITESVLEIYRNRARSSNELLQRNVWGCLDAVAQHLDSTGFSRTFRDLAPRMLRAVPLTDPAAMDFEYDLVTRTLGFSEREASKNGVGRKEFTALMQVAEKCLSGKPGLKGILKKDFSFLAASRNACGRSTDMLRSHPLPGMILPKIIPSVVIGIINVVAIETIIITFITIVVLLVMWWFGC